MRLGSIDFECSLLSALGVNNEGYFMLRMLDGTGEIRSCPAFRIEKSWCDEGVLLGLLV